MLFKVTLEYRMGVGGEWVGRGGLQNVHLMGNLQDNFRFTCTLQSQSIEMSLFRPWTLSVIRSSDSSYYYGHGGYVISNMCFSFFVCLQNNFMNEFS